MEGKRNIAAFAGGIALIAAGFWTLARGSMTLAPVLLLAGYCVAIPLGIMMRGGRRSLSARKGQEERANSSAG